MRQAVSEDVVGTVLQDKVKICSKCKEEKRKSEFSKCLGGRDGLHSRCKPCRSKANSEWNKSDKDRTKKRMSAWRRGNKEKIKEYNNNYKNLNKDRLMMKAKEWINKNPDRIKEINIKEKMSTRYGITPSDYAKILISQGGVCAICGIDTPGRCGRFHIDHCHDTGVVRGLLCSRCNMGIGQLRDSVEIMLSAIRYLESNRAMENYGT